MEAYPPEYVEHNLPLLLISGLGERQDNGSSTSMLHRQENGTKFQCSLAECSGERAQHLLQQFLQLDGSNLPWNASSLPGPSGTLRYRMKAIGRVGTAAARPRNIIPQTNELLSRLTPYHLGRLHRSLNPRHLKDCQSTTAVRLKRNCIRLSRLCLLAHLFFQTVSSVPCG